MVIFLASVPRYKNGLNGTERLILLAVPDIYIIKVPRKRMTIGYEINDYIAERLSNWCAIHSANADGAI
jgi:hypothetical protein